MPWGAVAGAVIGGVMQADAASSAADQQAASGRESIAFQREIADRQRADLAPWRQQGQSALNRINQLYGFGGPAPVAPRREDYIGGLSTGASTAGSSPAKYTGANFRPLKLPNYLYSENRKRENRARRWNSRVVSEDELAGLTPEEWVMHGSTGGEIARAKKANRTFDQSGYDAAQSDYEERLDEYNRQQEEYDPSTAAQDFLVMDPSYQFRLGEGQKAIRNSLLARGGALSGSALKAAQRYGQGLASQEFGNAYNRLASLSSQGQNSAAQQAAFSGQLGASAGETMLGIGNAQAAGTIGANNAWQNVINQGASLYGQYMQNREKPSLPGY